MGSLLSFTFVVFALAVMIIQFRDFQRFGNFIHLLFFLAVGAVFQGLTKGTEAFFLTLFALVIFNFLAAEVLPLFFKKPFVRLIVPMISVAAFLILFRSEVVSFADSSTLVVNKFLVAGVTLTLICYDIGRLKLRLFSNNFGGLEADLVMRSLLVFLAGTSLYLGFLGASFIGILVVTAVYLMTAFFRSDDSAYLSVSMLDLIAAGAVLLSSGYSDIFLFSPDSIFGLFIGAFFLYFLDQTDGVRSKTLSFFLSYLFPLIIASGIILLGNLFEPMGGLDSLAAILIGISLANSILGKNILAIPLSLIMIALTGFFGHQEKPLVNQEVMKSLVIKDAEQYHNYTSLDTLLNIDLYVVPDSSQVFFELGKRKETKGEFKKVHGDFSFGEDLEHVSYDVHLELKEFTTYNAFRDESLMDEEYFNAKLYPEITYRGEGLKDIGDNLYEMNGLFQMLGKTKNVKVELRRLNLPGAVQFTGSGKLDRTQFGMTPSTTEGNSVDFTFHVQLEKEI